MMDINEVERTLIMQQTCFRNFIAAHLLFMLKSFYSVAYLLWEYVNFN